MSTQAARQACSFFLARLEAEVARLREVDFPGHHTGPRKWVSFIAGILDTGRSYLDSSADPATPTDEAAKLIQYAERLGDYAYNFLTHVAGADATQIPHQVVAPFQRWVERLGISNTIFFRAEHLPNYELWTFDASNFANRLNSPAQSLIDAINAIKWPVLRVTVPGQAMGMLPHFAVVAHELGHAIQDRIKPDFAPHQKKMDDCYARIKARLTTNGKAFAEKESMRANQIVDWWINELKADAVGQGLVGPAFFFALCGFLELARQSYGISESHPPSDLRRTLLLGQLSAGAPSFIEVFRTRTDLTIDEEVNSPHLPRCPPAEKLFSDLATRLYLVDAAICVELVPYLRDIAPCIFDAAHTHLSAVCPELIYKPEQLAFDLETHLDLLCTLVPPIEYRDGGGVHATTLASILNVGWAALLTRLDKIPETPGSYGDGIARKMERLHELLLKSVELSEARRLWEEYR